MKRATESRFINAVVNVLRERGQAAQQFVTSQIDGSADKAPDIVFSPDEPGRVVVVEVIISNAYRLDVLALTRALRHREKILRANTDVVYVLASNRPPPAAILETLKKADFVFLELDLGRPELLAERVVQLARSL